jgi:hypothetical protein
MSEVDTTREAGDVDGGPAAALPASLGEVAALAAHELGNAMMVLSFTADALRTKRHRRDELRDVEEMESVIAQASTVVGLLGRLFAAPTPPIRLDLGQVIADAMPLLQRLGRRPIEISRLDAPASVVASRSHVERALFEIVLAATRLDWLVRSARLVVEHDPDDQLLVALEADAADRADDDATHSAARAPRDGAWTLRELPSGAIRLELVVR